MKVEFNIPTIDLTAFDIKPGETFSLIKGGNVFIMSDRSDACGQMYYTSLNTGVSYCSGKNRKVHRIHCKVVSI